MTWDLSAMVAAGEIVNTCVNQVHGWLRLTGMERPVYLNLTGNLCCDLVGRRLTFENRAAVTGLTSSDHVARQQIGPTGDMTLMNGRLMLEWFSQNGHMLCNVRPSVLQVGDRAADVDDRLRRENSLLPVSEGGGLFAKMSSLDALRARRHTSEKHLDRQFDILESMIGGSAELAPDKSTTLGNLVSSALELPAPALIHGDRLQRKVKEVLAHLAILGVTLELCHHFHPRQAYELLRQSVLTDAIHPESMQSGYLMHYLTFEHCDDCLAEEETWVHEHADIESPS